MEKTEVDLVVIAAGPAGLAAAIAAAEKDASVAVLEKSNTAGGASNMGMGPLGIESKVQRDQMIGITKNEAFKKFMNYTHWRSDSRLVREYLYKSGDTIGWLESMGVNFEGAYRYFAGNGAEASWHIVKPESGKPGPRAAGTMIKRMTERLGELGGEIYYETPAKKILKKDGRIVGVLAEGKNGELQIDCNAVVVATGGFGDNPEMIRELTPYEWGKTLYSFRIPGNVGDGMKMAWEAGAAKTDFNMECAYSPVLNGEYRALARVHCQPNLTVNLLGERFVNEEVMANNTFMSNALALQKDMAGFSIIDDTIKNFYYKNGIENISLVAREIDIDGYDEDIEAAEASHDPGVFAASSIQELAEQIGIDPGKLQATVDEYNAMCSTRDTLFYKSPKFMKPLIGPKFYAVRLAPGGYGSLGGIKVNYKCEAIDESFAPVPGLYAAGTDACAIYGDSYVFILPGNTMGFAVNSGRIAGENAVDYLLELYKTLD